ncbi:hypothetical protein Sjap_014268 [Stephania japonica]|uniref:Uncharacterized protein n=1 Tax=Stephania japonica TaxID=461633 RepID=A0AAP0J223_9MAGN
MALVMGTTSYCPPLAAPISVISTGYCTPYSVDLAIIKKVMTITDGNFAVSDVNGNILFKVKGALLSLRDRRLQSNCLPATKAEIHIPTKKSSPIQFKTQLDVFLASNKSEDNCDFKIKGSWLGRSCVIYAGDSSAIIAQIRKSLRQSFYMHKKRTVQSIALGKDTFSVTVYPNVDHAFIVSLIVILNEINEDRDD